MTEKTVTRADLTRVLHSRVGLSKSESAAMVQTILDEMIAALLAGETVKVPAFGRFSVLRQEKRTGRNPRTGEEVPIPPRTTLAFRASAMLKEQMNQTS